MKTLVQTFLIAVQSSRMSKSGSMYTIYGREKVKDNISMPNIKQYI